MVLADREATKKHLQFRLGALARSVYVCIQYLSPLLFFLPFVLSIRQIPILSKKKKHSLLGGICMCEGATRTDMNIVHQFNWLVRGLCAS